METSIWIYYNHKIEKIIFQCDGSLSMSEADSLFKQATGIDPIKNMSIGVSNTGWARLSSQKD